LSSKLRKLKQQAYEAGRRRDWAAAADAYAQILDQDRNNPSLLNEYGDVCLKSGDVAKAIRQFLSAASKYRQNGLLNNAQAVYKKVLRHESGNLNANWYLAEIRSAQGLLVEGAKHALVFLASAEEVSGEIKEIFLKRCLELFTLYTENDQILERVEGIFRIWNMPLEAARAGCLRACLAYRDGNQEAAHTSVRKLIAATPEITNYAEHTRWLEQSGQKSRSVAFSDVNAIDLDAPADAEAVPEHAVDDPHPAVQDDPIVADSADDPVFEPEGDDHEVNTAEAEDLERDAEGCISIDVGGETSFADLLDEAVDSISAAAPPADHSSSEGFDEQTAIDDVLSSGPAAGQKPFSGTVNLLDEILAEEGQDIVRSSDNEQVSTIASEIGRNLSESADIDPEAQYQQGLVYLEMGLYDQAVMALSNAARHRDYRLQACEMWGIALQRAGHADEALQILEECIATTDAGGREALGLRYHAGRILEDMGRMDEAQEHYRTIHACDAGFADVIKRLRVSVI
jgi:tetratricopeptide (TPR) repeat protein